jgi:hypothetical protein
MVQLNMISRIKKMMNNINTPLHLLTCSYFLFICTLRPSYSYIEHPYHYFFVAFLH